MGKLGLVLLLIVAAIILLPGVFGWLFGMIGFVFKVGLVLMLIFGVMALIGSTKKSDNTESRTTESGV